MTEYSSSIDLASRLIIKKGRVITIRRKRAAEIPDQNRPWAKAAPNEKDYKPKAVVLDYDKKLINGTTIKTGDKQALVPAKNMPVEPDTTDQVYDQGRWWAVIRVETLKPGDEPVLYILQLRV